MWNTYTTKLYSAIREKESGIGDSMLKDIKQTQKDQHHLFSEFLFKGIYDIKVEGRFCGACKGSKGEEEKNRG